VQIAIVIVSADLRIRRFTPMAEKVLNLIPGDLDRLIGHINPNLDGANLEQLIVECIDTILPVEREVQDRQGRWYSLRIRPYRSVENRIDGAVLALFDIDAPKRHEESARLATSFAEAVVQSVPEPMAIVDNELRLRSVSARFAELFGLAGDGVRGRTLSEFVRGSRVVDQLVALSKQDPPADAAMTIDLQPNGSKAMPFEARSYRGIDGPQSRLIVLTASTGRGRGAS
jgi:two-component system CheB/CheR fusion protein